MPRDGSTNLPDLVISPEDFDASERHINAVYGAFPDGADFDDYITPYKEALTQKIQDAKTYGKFKEILSSFQISFTEDIEEMDNALPVPLVAKGVATQIADLVLEGSITANQIKIHAFDSRRGNGLLFKVSCDDEDNDQDYYWHRYSYKPLSADDYKNIKNNRKAPRKNGLYSRASIREAMALFYNDPDNEGKKLGAGSYLITGECALNNGKRTWDDVYMAFYQNRVDGVAENTAMDNFMAGEGFIASTATYTKDNVREAMALFYDDPDNEGKKLGQGSGVITEGCALNNGKRTWDDVYMAFHSNRVDGVPDNMTMGKFMVGEDFIESMLTYTADNVREAMALFYDDPDNEGKKLGQGSGVITEGCALYNGKRTWNDVYVTFYYNRVDGVPENTTMDDFMVGEGFIASTATYTKDNVRKAMALFYNDPDNKGKKLGAGSGLITGECALNDGKRTWNDVYMAFYDNRVDGVPENTTMGEFSQEEFGTRLRNAKKELNLKSVFNTVAWAVIKEEPISGNDKEPIKRGNLKQKNIFVSKRPGLSIEAQKLAQNFADKTGRSFHDLNELMVAGGVPGIPKGMLLETFAAGVAKRIASDNFAAPTP